MSKIGCASITWPNLNTTEAIEHMLAEVAACGYDGVETGSNALELMKDPDTLKRRHLRLVGVHCGGDFRQIEDAVLRETYLDITRRAKFFGAEFVFISGANYPRKNADDYHIDAHKYNVIGQAVKDAGLMLCYHNHHFEFKKNRLGLNILTSETDPKLVGLLPDLGWVYRGDMEPVDFLKEFGDRVKAVHFKEFTFDDHFSELGTGVVDFKPAYNYIKNRDLWIIAEQDTCTGAPSHSARKNAEYMFQLTGRC